MALHQPVAEVAAPPIQQVLTVDLGVVVDIMAQELVVLHPQLVKVMPVVLVLDQ
jgi:hypothetical protein